MSQEWGASLLSFSPHRFYGPKGVGVLYQNRRARLAAILQGGDQENGRRAGVENVPAIVGAGVAAEIAGRDLAQRSAHCARLQRRLWEGLRARISHIKLNGPEPGPGRHPATLNISTEFIEGEGQLLLCDMHGIAVASGSGCVSRSAQNLPRPRRHRPGPRAGPGQHPPVPGPGQHRRGRGLRPRNLSQNRRQTPRPVAVLAGPLHLNV